MANCIHCKKPIRLIPSAEERARVGGGVASDYVKLFTAHGDCTVKYRNKLAMELIAKNS